MFLEVERISQQRRLPKGKQNERSSRPRTFSEEGRTIDTVSTRSGSSIGSSSYQSKQQKRVVSN
jgi:hypothetical protein